MENSTKIMATILLALLSFPGFSSQAQSSEGYAIQANFIYHFTKYIDWPGDKKKGDFIIGIVGESPLFDALKNSIGNKKSCSQKIVIKKFPPFAASFDCHILFVNDGMSSHFKKILAATAGAPTLLVTESEGLAHRGSCVNFIIVDNRLKLEINKNNITQRNLSIASELLQLGIPVK